MSTWRKHCRGDTHGARSAVVHGVAIAVRTGEAIAAAELLRLQGELALRGEGDLTACEQEAESHFHAAIAIARKQQARSWELRAAISLARLWDGQGKCESAPQQLLAVYAWFAGAFDTRELMEAKALLDDLSAVR